MATGQPLFRNIHPATASLDSSSAAVPSTSNQPASTNLSTGTKAGIGAGIALGAIMRVALAWLFFVWRRHRKAGQELDYYLHNHMADIRMSDVNVASGFKAELPPLGSSPRAQLQGATATTPPKSSAVVDPKAPVELEGRKTKIPPVELEASVIERFRAGRS
jgi:hypothetical protein